MSIEVIKPGAFSTFQDLGRWGSQHIGVPVSGPMDIVSHRIANRVVGNVPGEATLETTLIGPSLLFTTDAVVAWCGADMSITLDGVPVQRAMATAVAAGATLTFGKRVSGLRCYLALQGGYDLHPVLGSCSTHVRSGLGGFHGRPLKKGDRIDTKDRRNSPKTSQTDTNTDLAVDSEAINAWIDAQPALHAPICLMTGREWLHFTDKSRHQLLDLPWKIDARSERMGCRLEGLALQRETQRDVLSEAVSFGAMQVPPDGQPIILMADRQTSGGYPKIAQVAGVDLPRVAQRAPGEFLSFALVSVDQAQALLAERDEALRRLGV